MRDAVQYLMSCEEPMVVLTVVNYETPHLGVVKRISNERHSLVPTRPSTARIGRRFQPISALVEIAGVLLFTFMIDLRTFYGAHNILSMHGSG